MKPSGPVSRDPRGAAPAQLRHLGRYEIECEIARGAMGVVYRARDPIIDRVVAIKTVDPGLTGAALASFRERFFREARAAGGLNHPCIVTIHDAGEAGGVAYMAMELLEGATLRDLLCGKPLPVERSLDVAMQVAYALAYAHDAGIVHRDVKPENIVVVGKRRVKLTDFGIASLVRVPGGDEEIVGSPKYMSPEQARGGDVDGRADLFSLGVVLYEMLTGVQPFAAPGVEDTVRRVRETTPDCPSELNPLVPPEIDALVMRMLAKDPEERVSSARRLYRELRKWLKARGAEVDERDDQLEKLDSTVHRPSSARESTLVMRDKGKAKRHGAPWRRPALAGALVGVLLASGVALWSFGVSPLAGESVADDVAAETPAHRAVASAAIEPALHPAEAAASASRDTQTVPHTPGPDAAAADAHVPPAEAHPAGRAAHASGTTASGSASRARPARRGHAEAAPVPQPVVAPAPPETVAELPPPPAVRTATVRFAIVPWGEVFVDGKFRGMTPPMESVELPPGRHRLEIRNGILPTYIADVRLDAGDTEHIRHRFE